MANNKNENLSLAERKSDPEQNPTGRPGASQESPGRSGGEPTAPGRSLSGPEVHAYIGRQLRAVYDDVARQPVPDRFVELMKQLDVKTGAR